ncbi:MAG: methyltransferase [Rhizomicrobium sp.]
MSAVTDDKFLGGRVLVRQSTHGFRAGLDAVMLAAAVPARSGENVLELGSGAGTASLCLAGRVHGLKVVGMEIDAALADLANGNARANAMDGLVSFVVANALDPPPALRRPVHHVLCNPPFHGENGQVSPDAARARALQDGGELVQWLVAGVKRSAPKGTFTAILRADRLGEALAGLPERGVTVFPLWPRADAPAKRVIIQIRKDARAPLAILPGLVLHDAGGAYTAEADAILRGGKAITF